MIKLPYQKLLIWQKGMELARKTYAVTKNFPSRETYALSMQMQRASVSVPSNIAEGSQRGTPKDFRNFLMISLGSLAELETQFILAHQVGYLAVEELDITILLIREIARMMSSFAKKLTADRSH